MELPWLADVHREGAGAHPQLDVSPAAFAAHIASVPGLAAGARPAHPGDLYLACAACAGVPGGRERFLDAHLATIRAGVRAAVPAAGPRLEDLAQTLVIDLLYGRPPARAKLFEYSGRGPLRAWLRVTCVRRMRNDTRDLGRHLRADTRLFEESLAESDDPELAYLKDRYAGPLDQALREALAALEPGARALLRLHYGDGIPLEKLARIHGWSKSTAGRHVADARDAVLRRAAELVVERLAVDEAELSSLYRLVRSRIHAGLSSLLRGSEAERA